MKVANRELKESVEPMRKLLALKLPIKASMALVKLAKQLKPQEEYIQTISDKLITDHGEPHPTQQGGFQINEGCPGFPKFCEELGVLMDEEVEIDFEVVTLPDNIEIEPYVLMALEKFVTLD